MATLGANNLTLIDWAKRTDPSGDVLDIVELLQQRNEILLDMQWQEGNLPTGHLVAQRTGLPSVFYRLINQPVAPSKSTTAQITEAAAILEAWSEVDCALARLNGDVNAFRLSEAMAFLEAMNQQMASTLFYGNATINQEQFTGLAPRYSSTTAGNGANVILGGGAGADNASIWLVAWSPMTVFGIFPKGSQAGLVHEDFGEQTVTGTAGVGGTRMRAYQERWVWNCGIALKDWRYTVRIPNIDISALTTKVSAADLPELMIRAIHRIPDEMGQKVFYMNRTCREMLDIQLRDDVQTGGQLTYEVVDGMPVYRFRGVPVRVCDALIEAEALVA